MSKLTSEILEREGKGIPSKAYRGPEYWYNSKGLSVKQLWDQRLRDHTLRTDPGETNDRMAT